MMHMRKPELVANAMQTLGSLVRLPIKPDTLRTGPEFAERATCVLGCCFVHEGALLETVLWGSRAAAECKSKFDVPDRTCVGCDAHLPATFFHAKKKSCISCVREDNRRRRTIGVTQVVPEYKECTRCRENLPAKAFPLDKQHSTGLTSLCYQCRRERARQLRQLLKKAPMPTELLSSEYLCTACQQVKPRSAFRSDVGRPHGLQPVCGVCRNAFIRVARFKGRMREAQKWTLTN